MQNETESPLTISELPQQIKTVVELELAKLFTRLIKTLRIYTIVGFVTGVFSSSVCLAVALLVLGTSAHFGRTSQEMGTSAIVLGFIVALFSVAFVILAFWEKLWIKLFKIDVMLEDLQKASVLKSSAKLARAAAGTQPNP